MPNKKKKNYPRAVFTQKNFLFSKTLDLITRRSKKKKENISSPFFLPPIPITGDKRKRGGAKIVDNLQ